MGKSSWGVLQTQKEKAMESRMYAEAKTWNPFKGCGFGCVYCLPSFQRQAKRQKQRCQLCYEYTPHCHPERLSRIPSAEIIFVCGNGDLSFCPPAFTREIIQAVRAHNGRCPHKTYYFQSKQPSYFTDFVHLLPGNAIVLTTLETNRDAGYSEFSQAPVPSERFRQLRDLDYPRKVVTIEPVMDFDSDEFAQWVVDAQPEYVWLGYNSRPTEVRLPEPAPDKLLAFVESLTRAGVPIRPKDLRGLDIGECSKTGMATGERQ